MFEARYSDNFSGGPTQRGEPAQQPVLKPVQAGGQDPGDKPESGQRNPKQLAAAQRALDDLFSLVYEELRHVASLVRRNEADATISSTALLHEAWMKLRDSPPMAAQSLAHFKAIAARAMRQVLVDQARQRTANKRGAGEVIFVGYEEAGDAALAKAFAANEDMLALDAALNELEGRSARQARVFEERFFGGLAIAEIAGNLGISESAIERDWRAAKAWLASKMHRGTDGKSAKD